MVQVSMAYSFYKRNQLGLFRFGSNLVKGSVYLLPCSLVVYCFLCSHLYTNCILTLFQTDTHVYSRNCIFTQLHTHTIAYSKNCKLTYYYLLTLTPSCILLFTSSYTLTHIRIVIITHSYSHAVLHYNTITQLR